MGNNLNQMIGSRLKEARTRAGYSVNQAAFLFECTPQNYRRIERGIQILTPEKLVLLHSVMDIDPLFLLTGESRQEPPSVPPETDDNPFRSVHELYDFCRTVAAD